MYILYCFSQSYMYLYVTTCMFKTKVDCITFWLMKCGQALPD